MLFQFGGVVSPCERFLGLEPELREPEIRVECLFPTREYLEIREFTTLKIFCCYGFVCVLLRYRTNAKAFNGLTFPDPAMVYVVVGSYFPLSIFLSASEMEGIKRVTVEMNGGHQYFLLINSTTSH